MTDTSNVFLQGVVADVRTLKAKGVSTDDIMLYLDGLGVDPLDLQGVPPRQLPSLRPTPEGGGRGLPPGPGPEPPMSRGQAFTSAMLAPDTAAQALSAGGGALGAAGGAKLGASVGSLGGPAGSLLGGTLGAAGGAFLGGSAGSAAGRGLATGEDLQVSSKDLSRGAVEGAFAGLPVPVLQATRWLFQSGALPTAKRTLQAAGNLARSRGGRLPPVPAAALNRGGRIMTGLARGTLVGDEIFRSQMNRVAQHVNQVVNQTQQAIGEPVERVVTRINDFAQTMAGKRDAAVGVMNQVADRIGRETPVPLTRTMAAMDSAIDSLTKTRSNKPLLAYLKTQRKTLQEGAELTFDQAEAMRKRVGELARKKAATTTSKGFDVGRAFYDDYAQLASDPRIAEMLSGAAEDYARSFKLLKRTNIKKFEEVLASKEKFLSSLYGPNGREAARLLKTTDRELYNRGAQAWIAGEMKRNTEFVEGLGEVLDGIKLRSWFEANEGIIKEHLGTTQRFTALDNFTAYADGVTRALRSSGATTSRGIAETGGRAAVEAGQFAAGAAVGGPAGVALVMGPQLAAPALAANLLNPEATLFKLFTQGVSPAKGAAAAALAGGTVTDTPEGQLMGGELVNLGEAAFNRAIEGLR